MGFLENHLARSYADGLGFHLLALRIREFPSLNHAYQNQSQH